jgi:hypothetical protein
MGQTAKSTAYSSTSAIPSNSDIGGRLRTVILRPRTERQRFGPLFHTGFLTRRYLTADCRQCLDLLFFSSEIMALVVAVVAVVVAAEAV